MYDIEIIIRGQMKSGKTTIASAIQSLLVSHWHDVEMEDDCPDPLRPGIRKKCWEELPKKSIVIRILNVAKSAPVT